MHNLTTPKWSGFASNLLLNADCFFRNPQLVSHLEILFFYDKSDEILKDCIIT